MCPNQVILISSHKLITQLSISYSLSATHNSILTTHISPLTNSYSTIYYSTQPFLPSLSLSSFHSAATFPVLLGVLTIFILPEFHQYTSIHLWQPIFQSNTTSSTRLSSHIFSKIAHSYWALPVNICQRLLMFVCLSLLCMYPFYKLVHFRNSTYRRVRYSYLGQDREYPGWEFSWYSVIISGNFQDNTEIRTLLLLFLFFPIFYSPITVTSVDIAFLTASLKWTISLH